MGTSTRRKSYQDTPSSRTKKQRTSSKKKKRAPAAAEPAEPTREELAEANAALKAKIAKQEAHQVKLLAYAAQNSGTAPKKSAKKGLNESLERAIREIIRTKLFRKVKFVSSEEQEEAFARMVLEELGYDFKNKEEEQDWIDRHRSAISSMLAGQRNYVQNLVKKDAKTWYDQHGKTLPTKEDIFKCLTRKIDFKNAGEKEIMTWWVDKVLAHAPGNNHDWSVSVRHFATISEAAPQDNTRRLYMTPATEAFAALVFYNCRDAWMEQFKLKEEYPDREIIQAQEVLREGHHKYEAPPDGVVLPLDVDGKPEYQFRKGGKLAVIHPKFKGKYTKPDCGSDTFGGWTPTGLNKFNKLVKDNKTARKEGKGRKCMALEYGILSHLRDTNGIKAKTYADHLRNKRKRKRDDGADVEALPDTWGDDSEASDDEDEGSEEDSGKEGEDGEDDDDKEQEEEEEPAGED